MKLVVQTWKKTWEFKWEEGYSWQVTDSWIIVTKAGKDAKVFYFPKERVIYAMITKEEEKQ